VRLARVPAEGRVPLDRRPLGHRTVDRLDPRAGEGVRSPGVSDRRTDTGGRDLPDAVRVSRNCRRFPNIGYWRRSGGDTSRAGGRQRRAAFPSGCATTRAASCWRWTHNTDIADSFEREADDPAYFTRFSAARIRAGSRCAALRADTHSTHTSSSRAPSEADPHRIIRHDRARKA
jgi:hypothetical protein